MNYNATALARALGRSSDDIKIIELGAQLFPQRRTDLARQQARMADIIATSRSPDEVSDAILINPTESQREVLDEAAAAASATIVDDPTKRDKVAAAARREAAVQTAADSLASLPSANQGSMRPAAVAVSDFEPPPMLVVQGVDIVLDGRYVHVSLEGTKYWLAIPEFEASWGQAPERSRPTTVKLIPLDVDSGKTMREAFAALGPHWRHVDGAVAAHSDSASRKKASGSPKQFRGWIINMKSAGFLVRALAELDQ